jgi:DNA polymerase III epsilon subunit-like protein
MTFTKVKNLKEAPIAMTDLETSGDVFGVHEILEIGLVVFDQKSFEILDTLNVKVKPIHIENAVPAALEKNGYTPKDWDSAASLDEAIGSYVKKTKGAIFCAYNATFDWGFMSDAFRITGIKDEMDYHRLDLLSIAWSKGLADSPSWNLKTACKMFGVAEEAEVHRAINGAKTAYELYRKLMA